MNNTTESQNRHINNPFDKLTATQWRFITAMLEDRSRTKAEAAVHVGLTPPTVYRWPEYVNDALKMALDDLHAAALEYRKQQILKAIAVKTTGLNSDDESIRQKVASEFIEWELGKAIQPLTGKDGKPLMEGLVINIGDSDQTD